MTYNVFGGMLYLTRFNPQWLFAPESPVDTSSPSSEALHTYLCSCFQFI